MREVFSVCWLIGLHSASLMLTAIGSCFSTAASFLHITWIRQATTHDVKYGIVTEQIVTDVGEQRLPSTAANQKMN